MNTFMKFKFLDF